ncbi:aminotransferase class I/II-fold pyridoxal phosphate-dependent enzyme [Streptomyces boncukensis]|uniref:Aminotransferase class I/II-fold pyridoxal phosphate-dependent enzyme n=1 Tax=Streptomyces boncukensis TaxID=2711219 RepID=A0A6G4WYB0_9ACTN|nr:aminotransferase class I/II-fold pyridoxal phosphate-dependent enzyme [Streptomyces boncukensis]NGO69852.1 aminotransferase class I/II-fold pyridoxal phosphate-dependent enzyme [Streptomyces boncukensis]
MRRTDDDRAGTIGAAASGYWRRRGVHTDPGQVVAAPGAPLLLLALLAAVGGAGAPPGAPGRAGVLLTRPCTDWYPPQARLLGRPVRGVPVPAECGGVPDPFALLETVRRARAEGEEPRLLVLSVADDVTGTAAPPELLHEVCEAAADEGLVIVSDETWRDTSHSPHDTVIVSPAEMLEGSPHADGVVLLAGLGATLLPPGLHAGVARFPRQGRGRALGAAVREVLGALHAELSAPVAAAVADALAEPEPLRRERAAAARRHGACAAALYTAVTSAGALCRPPHAGRQLYADLEQSRTALAARGIADAEALEAELVRRLGPYVSGGHRFGDDPRTLRFRLTTDVLTDTLTTPDASSPAESPEASETLDRVQSVLADLTDGSPQ